MMQMHKPAKEKKMDEKRQKLLDELVKNYTTCQAHMGGLIAKLEENKDSLDLLALRALDHMKSEYTKATINISLLRTGFFE